MLRYDPSRRTVLLHIGLFFILLFASWSIKYPRVGALLFFKGHGRIRRVLDVRCLAFWLLGLYLYTKLTIATNNVYVPSLFPFLGIGL